MQFLNWMYNIILQILLKGSPSDELKRVKYVVQIAVIVAHHLILETSYLVDRKAMFSTILFAGVGSISTRDQHTPVLGTDNSSIPGIEESAFESEKQTIEIPISNGFHEEGSHNLNTGLEGNSTMSHVAYNPAIFSGLSSLSASLKRVIGDSFPLASSAPCLSLSSYFGFNGKEPNDQITEEVPVSKTWEVSDHGNMEAKDVSDKEKSPDDGQPQPSSSYSEAPMDTEKDFDNSEDKVQSKDDVNAVLDSQSILVLMSRRNALRGTICEQSHFSHIMFYKNFDVPLGKFLRDNVLNQVFQIFIYYGISYLCSCYLYVVLDCSNFIRFIANIPSKSNNSLLNATLLVLEMWFML